MKLKALSVAIAFAIASFAGMSIAHGDSTAPKTAQIAHVVDAPQAVVAPSHSFELIASAHADGLVEPTSPEAALGLLPTLINAVKSSNWGIVASLVLMLLVYLLKSFVIPQASANWSRFLAAFLPVISMLGMSLYAGQNIPQALLSAVFVGAAATGFWEWVGQHILPQKPSS